MKDNEINTYDRYVLLVFINKEELRGTQCNKL